MNADQRAALQRLAREAPHVCTPLELDALAAYLQHGGRRTAAQHLNISETAFRGRLNNATRKLRTHLEQHPDADAA